MPDAVESRKYPSSRRETPARHPAWLAPAHNRPWQTERGRPKGRPLPDRDMPVGYSDDFATRRRLIHVRTLTPSSPSRAAVGSGMVVKLDSVPWVTRLTFPASTRQ